MSYDIPVFRTNLIQPWNERKEKNEVSKSRTKDDTGEDKKESDFEQKSWQLRGDEQDGIDLNYQADDDLFWFNFIVRIFKAVFEITIFHIIIFIHEYCGKIQAGVSFFRYISSIL